MKVPILAGGKGTRLGGETLSRPKALVEVGGKPIIWHVMRHYARHSFREFVIAAGYRKEDLLRYFKDYHWLNGNLTVALGTGATRVWDADPVDWLVHVVDTGPETMTGGRIKRLAPHLGDDTFMLTWCDGVSDVDLGRLLAFHRAHGRLATMTIVQPPGRFGHVETRGDSVTSFQEKPDQGGQWVNGAFFVLEPGVFDYIDGDATMWGARHRTGRIIR